MLRNSRLQVTLSSTCLVFTLVLYCFYHSGSKHAPRLFGHGQSEYGLEYGAAGFSSVLHYEDHAFRLPRKTSLHFNVTSEFRSPDGVKKRVYLINGHFPGPTIEARSGDELEIEIENSLDGDDDGIGMHWHGLSMRGASAMDGVVGVTQAPIRPKERFTYRFKIEDAQAGTFWYHAHSQLQRADGLYGALIVHAPAARSREHEGKAYDEDRVLLVGDWYHRAASQVLDYYTNWRNFGNEPAPDSMLINGRGAFNCSMAVPARPVHCHATGPPALQLAPRTRLRIINTGALTGVTVSISGHAMSLYTLDGGNHVAPSKEADSLGILYPGQRMDVIVTQKPAARNQSSELIVALDPENMKFPNLALTAVQKFPIKPSSAQGGATPLDAPQDESSFFDLADAKSPASAVDSFPAAAQRTFVLYTKVEILAEFRNIPKGFINRTSWPLAELESAPLASLTPRERRDKVFMPFVSAGEDAWVDVVLNNMDDKGHPFHLHGYDFYVLSSYASPDGRRGQFNPFDADDGPPGGDMNLRDPVKADTVFVPRMGYVVLRFRANNRGLWYFHCHVLWHEAVGMAMAFEVGE